MLRKAFGNRALALSVLDDSGVSSPYPVYSRASRDSQRSNCHERDLNEVPTIHEREPNEVRMIPNESIYKSLIMQIGVIYNYGGHYVMNSSLTLYN